MRGRTPRRVPRAARIREEVDGIRDIFASVDGALPERPFASFTAEGPAARAGGEVAVAAGTLAEPDGRHYVAFLVRGRDDDAHHASYVDEDLRLLGRAPVEDGEAGYEVRYLEAFDDAFEAGERYRFFWEALHPEPEPDDTPEERERDLRRGLRRVGEFLTERAVRATCDEVVTAEERASAARSPDERAFWLQAAETSRSELSRLVPNPSERERRLALHRYRHAAKDH
jgi:hypothetical protein